LTALADVKAKIVNVLKSDSALASLLGKDRQGQTPIYLGWQKAENLRVPSIIVSEVSETGEVSGLGDCFDGSKRYEWYHAIIQVDVWASSSSQRDQVSSQVKKVMLANFAVFKSDGIVVSPPSVAVLDEVDEKPPIFRHSLRYPVWYVMEVS